MNSEKNQQIAVILFCTATFTILTLYLFVFFGWLWIDEAPGSIDIVFCPMRQIVDACIYIGTSGISTGFKG